jgi:serine/threonine protein phosphatase PrpC
MHCPRCGATAPAGDLFCESDGTPLVPLAPPAAAGRAGAAEASPRGGAGALRCPCGAAEDDGDGYCARCGHRLVPADPAGQTDSEGAGGAPGGPGPGRPLAPDGIELAPTEALGATSDRGLHHPRNEDAVALAGVGSPERPAYVLVVCDGVSTSHEGDLAAQIGAGSACAALRRFVQGARERAAERTASRSGAGSTRSGPGAARRAMAGALREAHRAICAQVQARPGDQTPAGTTIVAALATPERVTVGWVGDSRAYWVGPAGAGLLTHDDSWVNEVVSRGEMSESEARQAPQAHALTHCLGPLEEEGGDPPPEPSVGLFVPPPGTRLVLCSDGLWNYAPEADDVARLVRAAPPEGGAQGIARYLVEYALAQGGQDNVTVAVACLP